MSALLNKLFSESQVNSILNLLEDKSSRLLVQKEIGKQLISHDDIIEELPFEQCLSIVSISPFATSELECSEVAAMKEGDFLPFSLKK